MDGLGSLELGELVLVRTSVFFTAARVDPRMVSSQFGISPRAASLIDAAAPGSAEIAAFTIPATYSQSTRRAQRNTLATMSGA